MTIATTVPDAEASRAIPRSDRPHPHVQGAQQPTAPVVNNGPRVGRNDPVPVARARNTRTATAADC